MGTLNAFAILHMTSKDGLTSPASMRCTWLLEILARTASSRMDIFFSIRIRSTYSFSICTHLPLVFSVPCCCLFEKILPFPMCPFVGTFLDKFWRKSLFLMHTCLSNCKTATLKQTEGILWGFYVFLLLLRSCSSPFSSIVYPEKIHLSGFSSSANTHSTLIMITAVSG